MKASVIISVYNNTPALKLILDSLKFQTEQDFEIIISEDGESDRMKQFVQNYKFCHHYIHLTQQDLGWRKNRALNRAIMTATTDWLIFIDGDCILHPQFIKQHLLHAADRTIVAGKRVKLNRELSDQFLRSELTNEQLSKMLFPYLFSRRGCRYIEEGFYLPNLPSRKVKHLTGCNMSMSKLSLMAINGFDENYQFPTVGEDYDIEWRLLALGYNIVSVRNKAIQYHLWHKNNNVDRIQNLNYCNEQQNRQSIITINGLNQYL